jgi:glycerol-3-phosphate dehydrogenase
VRYLIDHEWAQTAEDVVWRRSKLGLRLTGAELKRLQNWMAKAQGATTSAGPHGKALEALGGREPSEN